MYRFGGRSLVYIGDEGCAVPIERRAHILIGEVATSVSSGEKLFTHAILALYERDAQCAVCERSGSGQAGSSAAPYDAIRLQSNPPCRPTHGLDLMMVPLYRILPVCARAAHNQRKVTHIQGMRI